MLKKQANRSVRMIMVIVVVISIFALITPTFAQSEGRIEGLVFNDRNDNGVQDDGEGGVPDVEVIFETGDWRLLITTGLDGTYGLFLNPGTWTVSINPPEGFTAAVSVQDVYIANAGDEKTGIDFAVREAEDVLPESGGPISEQTLFIILITLVVAGVALIFFGQRRKSDSLA